MDHQQFGRFVSQVEMSVLPTTRQFQPGTLRRMLRWVKSERNGLMETATARLARIAPELPTVNVDAAIEFYMRRLGFDLAVRMQDGGYAFVERDGVAIHLFEDSARNHSPVSVHIFVLDIDELYAEFKARNVHATQEIERKPWGNRDFRIKDQFGNELEFTEPSTL